MDRLLEHLTDWKPFTALVVGDFMLDQQIYGDAERLSADAPVPILNVKRQTQNAGGAANVCLDLIALRAKVEAFGVIGEDQPGNALRAELANQGVSAAGLVSDPARPTTLKQNLIGLAQSRHPQKMFRVDYESREPIADTVVDELLSRIAHAMPRADVVCIEDYNKGVCTERLCQGVIDLARAAKKPVFVDPARLTDYARYRRATVITPNRTEAETATNQPTHLEADIAHNAALARTLLTTLFLDAVVLTLDRHGALLLEEGQTPVALPTIARTVYDVTGAGDMFLAALTAARANQCHWADAVRFANAAAGLEVEIFGVQPIPLERIHHAILEQSAQTRGKLRTLHELKVELAARRTSGQRVVFTNGCFDLLHAGHVDLLDKAARQGDFLVVGLNDDASVRRLKGPTRPVNTAEDRARVLGALGAVGAVVLFSEDTPLHLIESIRPDILVKGADYREDQVVGASLVKSWGGRIALIDLVEGKSTTGTIQRLNKAP